MWAPNFRVVSGHLPSGYGEVVFVSVQICALGRRNNLSINEWHNTGGPTPQAKTLLSTYIGSHSFEDNNVNVLARKDRWSERGVNESIHDKLEWPSLYRGGGLRHYSSPTYNALLNSLPTQLNNHSHQGSPSLSNPYVLYARKWP